MDEQRRRAYRAIAWTFLAIGGAVLGVAVAERLLGFRYFNASPVRVALFLAFIGAALMWTVRDRPDDPPASAPGPAPDDPFDDPPDDLPVDPPEGRGGDPREEAGEGIDEPADDDANRGPDRPGPPRGRR